MRRRVLAAWLPLMVLVGCLWRSDLDRVPDVGGDDGFELIKALTWARAPASCQEMWNDQPWLHTMLVGWAFRWLGPHAAIPRAFTVLSVAGLLAGCVWLVGRRVSPLGCAFLGVILLSAPPMPRLVLSAMLEPVAVGWAVLAVAVFYQPTGRAKRWRWLFSGALFAAAMHVKFTAAVVAPGAVALAWAWLGWKGLGRAAGWWLLGFAPVFGVLVVASPRFVLGELVGNHLGAYASASEAMTGMPPSQWWGLPCAVLAAGLGLRHFARHRRWPPAWFAVGMLMPAMAIALRWRPWWDYYVIHLAVPLALLGAVGFDRVARRFLRPGFTVAAGPGSEDQGLRCRRAGLSTARAVMLTAALAALWVSFSLPLVVREVKAVRGLATCDDAEVCRAFKRYAARARSCHSWEGSVPFQAGMLLPAQFTVLPKKRFLTGQLTEDRLAAAIRKRRPDLLLLERDEAQLACWTNWVWREYVLVARDLRSELWVHRSLDPQPMVGTAEQLRRMGL